MRATAYGFDPSTKYGDPLGIVCPECGRALLAATSFNRDPKTGKRYTETIGACNVAHRLVIVYSDGRVWRAETVQDATEDGGAG